MGKFNSIIAEPYRLFFPIGWLMAIIGTSYWIPVASGYAQHYQPLLHGLIQIELFCAAFAVGFLLTALPKFLRTRAPTAFEAIWILLVYSILAWCIFSGEIELAQWAFALLLMSMMYFALARFKERKALPPYSFALIAFGLLEGIIGALMLTQGPARFQLLGARFIEQGLFLSLSLGVGSFLGPRLMGVIDATNAVVSLPARADVVKTPWHLSPVLPVILVGAMIFLSFFIEALLHRQLGLSLRAAAAVYCLAHFGIFKLPRSRGLVGPFAAVSLWSMALGLCGAALFPAHEIGALHFTYISGFGFLIMTIGAQVISSHGGVPQFWQTHRTALIIIALLVAAAVVSRVAASLIPLHYLSLLMLSAVAFNIALIGWGMLTLPNISKIAK